MTFKIGDRVIMVNPPFSPSIPIGASGKVVSINYYKDADLIRVLWDSEDYNKRPAAGGGLYAYRLALEGEVSHLYSTLFTLEELTEW